MEEQKGERTERFQKHIPCGYAWIMVSNHPDVHSRVKYFPKEQEEDVVEKDEKRGKEVISHFIESLQDLEEELIPYMK